jgi:hypothetical protein
VIAFVKVTTRELKELDRSNADSCYFFMYPQKGTAPYATSMDNETGSKLLDAMGGVIHSATHNPQPPPDKQESAMLLQSVGGQLAQKYGADVQLLRGDPKDTTDRGKICTMAIDLYERILSLPPREASELLRYLLSPQ